MQNARYRLSELNHLKFKHANPVFETFAFDRDRKVECHPLRKRIGRITGRRHQGVLWEGVLWDSQTTAVTRLGPATAELRANAHQLSTTELDRRVIVR